MLDLLLNSIEAMTNYLPFEDLFSWLLEKLLRILIKYFFKN